MPPPLRFNCGWEAGGSGPYYSMGVGRLIEVGWEALLGRGPYYSMGGLDSLSIPFRIVGGQTGNVEFSKGPPTHSHRI